MLIVLAKSSDFKKKARLKIEHADRAARLSFHRISSSVAPYAGVFSVVSQRAGALRDDTKNSLRMRLFNCRPSPIPNVYLHMAMPNVYSVKNTELTR